MNIITKRLAIRPIHSSDTAFLCKLMNTPKWLQYIGDRNINSQEDAEAYMESNMHPDIAVKGFVNHVIIENASSQKIGTCSLHNRDYVDGMDIGYALLPQYEGKGFAREAASEMVKLAFGEYKQSKISAITDLPNSASQKVLQKIGFNKKGPIPFPESNDKVMLFTLLATDFQTKY